MSLKFKLRKRDGEVVACDSCGFQVPTTGFSWGPPYDVKHDYPERMLCEFCCTTMASRHTENPSRDEHSMLRAEIWRAAAGVFHMLNAKSKHGTTVANDKDKQEQTR